MMMEVLTADDVTVRAATQTEFATAVAWAVNEGWNPGLDDLASFYSADPKGFFMSFNTKNETTAMTTTTATTNTTITATALSKSTSSLPLVTATTTVEGAVLEPKGKALSSLSAVRFGPSYGFIGFYIVLPDYRGRGLGVKVWRAGLAHLGDDRIVGLDAVLEQQENYCKSGFVRAGRHVRYSGSVMIASTPDHDREEASEMKPTSCNSSIATATVCSTSTGTTVLPLKGSSYEKNVTITQINGSEDVATISQVLEYDADFCPGDRRAFISEWIAPKLPPCQLPQQEHNSRTSNSLLVQVRRRSLVARDTSGKVVGYGSIRICANSGARIGPLFADSPVVAERLFIGLVDISRAIFAATDAAAVTSKTSSSEATVTSSLSVAIDAPEDNLEAAALALRFGLVASSETVRMYRGGIPNLPVDRTYGLVCLELG